MQIKNWIVRIIAISAMGMAGTANAILTLTAAGTSQGFSLTTFASGFPATGYCCGPLGIGFTPSGGVTVVDYAGPVVTFATDTDNQLYSSATVGANYSGLAPVGFAQVGGNYYMTLQSGSVIQTTATGAYIRTVVPLGGATGLVADPATGKLYVSASGGIYRIDPVANTSVLVIGGGFDGLSVSGSTLYAEGGGQILGYNTTTFANTYASGGIPGGPDGVAIGTGSLANLLFINSNDGTFWEQDITTHVLTLLATGGSRGDFVQVDPNGSLLITQTDSIMRLTAASGGGFETSVPEPGTLALVGLAIAGLGLRRRKN